MKIYSLILQFFLMLFPWRIRKIMLNSFLKMKIDKGAKIGFSINLAKRVHLLQDSAIGKFNFINRIDLLILKKRAKLGRRNWITGISIESGAYKASPNRKCEFILGNDSRVTDRHFIDCNGGVIIGDFTTIAGIGTQIISHGINVLNSEQETDYVNIGNYCFIGTRCVFLKGTKIPNFCVLGAGSVVTKKNETEYKLYGGVPAKEIKFLNKDSKYFSRKEGNVK